MSQPFRKKTRSTGKQISELVRYMNLHKNFARSSNNALSNAVSNNDERWKFLSRHLAKFGPQKSIEQWKITWRDLKAKARNAYLKQLKCKSENSKSSESSSPLSNINAKVFAIVGMLKSGRAIDDAIDSDIEDIIKPNQISSTVLKTSRSKNAFADAEVDDAVNAEIFDGNNSTNFTLDSTNMEKKGPLLNSIHSSSIQLQRENNIILKDISKTLISLVDIMRKQNETLERFMIEKNQIETEYSDKDVPKIMSDLVEVIKKPNVSFERLMMARNKIKEQRNNIERERNEILKKRGHYE